MLQVLVNERGTSFSFVQSLMRWYCRLVTPAVLNRDSINCSRFEFLLPGLLRLAFALETLSLSLASTTSVLRKWVIVDIVIIALFCVVVATTLSYNFQIWRFFFLLLGILAVFAVGVAAAVAQANGLERQQDTMR